MIRLVLGLINRRAVAVAAILVFAIAISVRTSSLVKLSDTGGTAVVALLYDPAESAQHPEIRAVYDRFLDENGIPHHWYPFDEAILMPWSQLTADVRAVVLPDRIGRRVHDSFDTVLTAYVRRGGSLIVVQDAGDEDRAGFYRQEGVFDSLLGIHYIGVSNSPGAAFAFGHVHFTSPAAAERWNIPAGKVDDDGYLEGYGYGQLTYPMNRARRYAPGVDLDATFGESPVIARRRVGKGNVTYLNLPLGALKASGDSMPMEALMRTALYAGDRVPHLIPAPAGVARVIVNIHIDSNAEWLGIPNLLRHRLLRKDVRMEFDVTAGPDMAQIGDNQGFHACDGRGIPLLRTLAQYGAIGDHGGWAHNWFSSNLEAGHFTNAQVADLVRRNTQCLESILHEPIRSYAAPNGEHPQPAMSEIIESQGIDSYYYTGDSGSPALRPFFNGKLVGKSSWAYPVLTFGSDASVQEMAADDVAPSRAERWWEQSLDFISAQRGIYLIYTHSYDLRVHPQYIGGFSAFLDKLEAMQREGRLFATTMPEATVFLRRFMQTTFDYRRQGDGVSIDLTNPAGLRDIAFAVPESDVRPAAAAPSAVDLVGSDDGYRIYAVRSEATHVHLNL